MFFNAALQHWHYVISPGTPEGNFFDIMLKREGQTEFGLNCHIKAASFKSQRHKYPLKPSFKR